MFNSKLIYKLDVLMTFIYEQESKSAEDELWRR